MSTRYVGVIGPSQATAGQLAAAETIGRMLALESVVVVTGGLGGVMEAASRGAHEVGGVTLGLLPALTGPGPTSGLPSRSRQD